MPIINNIIFDLGGPIITIDYNLTSFAFKNLGAKNFDDLYSQAKQSELFSLYETGKITSSAFRFGLKRILNIEHVQDDEFDKAWNAMIIDLPNDRLDFLKKICKKYRTFLYSNTNEIHINEAFKMINNKCKITSLNSFFEKVYFSHTFGYRKPHPESFLKLLDENNLKAEDTLFIDDTKQHIDGAKKAGLQTFHLIGDLSIYDIQNHITKLQKD